jgi:hypothetical protein
MDRSLAEKRLHQAVPAKAVRRAQVSRHWLFVGRRLLVLV